MSLQVQAQAEIELRKRRITGTKFDRFKDQYFMDPAGFVEDFIIFPKGQGPAKYQLESLDRLPKEKRISIRGPHGLGKTTMAAWALLWFALTRDDKFDWKIPTLASAWRQLTKYLWPEIHLWARRLKWRDLGRSPFSNRLEMLTLSLKMGTGEAFALASDNPELIEGAHGSELLYIFDESKSIPANMWDAAEGAFATGNVYWLGISTPGEPNGRFYDIHKRAPGLDDWWVRHVTKDEAVAEGRINKSWCEQRKKQWGEASAVYQNRVLGEFASSSEDGVIPLAWVEKANERWSEWQEKANQRWREGQEFADQYKGIFKCVGVDVGRGGDKSVYALKLEYMIEPGDEEKKIEPTTGLVISELRRSNEKDVMPVAGRVRGILKKHKGYAIIDVIGVGAGVFDRLQEQRLEVVPFNASEKTARKDRSGELGFVNKRSAAWWNLRELLESENIALPTSDKLIGDLTAPKWRVMSGGKIQVESKDEIKKRLGRSPDDGDAVVMAFYEAYRSLVLFEV